MKVIKYPENITCDCCGAVIGEISEKDIRTFCRTEDRCIFILPVWGVFEYKGITCPCCKNEILFDNSRKFYK